KSIGAGNGVLVVRDSVDPQLVVQGSAIVHVNQVTTGISTTPKLPDSLQVGVNGRGQIIAKALDGNGYPIPGKSFVWTSRLAGFATVDQSGTVSGVTLGRTYVTDSVDGRIDSALVAVVQAPPALLQWGFKSLAVGNGGSVSVPLPLSRSRPGRIS